MSMPNSRPGRPFIIYVAGLGLGVAVGAIVITILFSWFRVDFSESEVSSAFRRDPTIQQATPINPTVVHAADQSAPTDEFSGVRLEGEFIPAVRYEVFLPHRNDNQAYRNAMKEPHYNPEELHDELVRQLDVLDLQAHYDWSGVTLNAEGDYRPGQYIKFIFDDLEEQNTEIQAMIGQLRSFAPRGFIHVRAYKIQVYSISQTPSGG